MRADTAGGRGGREVGGHKREVGGHPILENSGLVMKIGFAAKKECMDLPKNAYAWM